MVESAASAVRLAEQQYLRLVQAAEAAGRERTTAKGAIEQHCVQIDALTARLNDLQREAANEKAESALLACSTSIVVGKPRQPPDIIRQGIAVEAPPLSARDRTSADLSTSLVHKVRSMLFSQHRMLVVVIVVVLEVVVCGCGCQCGCMVSCLRYGSTMMSCSMHTVWSCWLRRYRSD